MPSITSAWFPPGDYGRLAIDASLVEAAKDYDPEAQTTVALTTLGCAECLVELGVRSQASAAGRAGHSHRIRCTSAQSRLISK